MKVCFVEWPVNLLAGSETWQQIAWQVREAAPDVLVTNEMPFGRWFGISNRFDTDVASTAVQQHEAGLDALRQLGVPLVLSSRPVWAGAKLANEAFALEQGEYRLLHHKHYFPGEPGWYESDWFHTGRTGFETLELAGIRVGVLLCTEVMFNEHARAYGRSGADLIIVPRMTGTELASWRTACAMAALVSGSYVVSSNKEGDEPDGPTFGGVGMAFAPDATLIAETSTAQTLVTFELDPKRSVNQRQSYPCYVSEVIVTP
ncbi:carbon-nitrogen hydrolase family protein [Leeia oryzae]|uniref:carbon-nitrogen hydrolase family protein n=1 Tax=Leeia oryzae TaxID=356662 RepID=UPI00036E813C|nr:carbon-nitrogen hydrolase family protein [Leeia oryzae]